MVNIILEQTRFRSGLVAWCYFQMFTCGSGFVPNPGFESLMTRVTTTTSVDINSSSGDWRSRGEGIAILRTRNVDDATRHQSPLFSTMGTDEKIHASMKPPAAAFGSPISDSMSDFNKSAITFVKDVLFDRILYPSSDINIGIHPSHVQYNKDITVTSTRTYARFYALETIARMPYFAYLSVLHLYETLGQFRKANYMKLHFTESWNEMHHLLIMEELGGNERWADRFVAQHAAFFLLLVHRVHLSH